MGLNILANLEVYAGSWRVVNTLKFNEEELAAIADNIVKASEYGSSVCLYLKSGGTSYIPLSTDAKTPIGKKIDLASAEVLVLKRDGERILRIRG